MGYFTHAHPSDTISPDPNFTVASFSTHTSSPQSMSAVDATGTVAHSVCVWYTRRPASADRTARRQFQPNGQPVSRTQASDAMTSRLPRYQAKYVQCRCFQCGSVPLRSDIKGTELPPASILIPLERQLIALQLTCWELLYNVDFCIG